MYIYTSAYTYTGWKPRNSLEIWDKQTLFVAEVQSYRGNRP